LSNRVERLTDVGVAGIHRVLTRADVLRSAAVVIVVAGMEGALPSVVGGLVRAPVIAVPTSVGYGASFGGVAALLGMLNSCAAAPRSRSWRRWTAGRTWGTSPRARMSASAIFRSAPPCCSPRRT